MASSNGARSVDEPTVGEANVVDDVSAQLDAFDAEHAADGYDPVPTLQLYETNRARAHSFTHLQCVRCT